MKIVLIAAAAHRRPAFILGVREFYLSYNTHAVNVDERDEWPEFAHLRCRDLPTKTDGMDGHWK